jgi:hypothetical protein
LPGARGPNPPPTPKAAQQTGRALAVLQDFRGFSDFDQLSRRCFE